MASRCMGHAAVCLARVVCQIDGALNTLDLLVRLAFEGERLGIDAPTSTVMCSTGQRVPGGRLERRRVEGAQLGKRARVVVRSCEASSECVWGGVASSPRIGRRPVPADPSPKRPLQGSRRPGSGQRRAPTSHRGAHGAPRGGGEPKRKTQKGGRGFHLQCEHV